MCLKNGCTRHLLVCLCFVQCTEQSLAASCSPCHHPYALGFVSHHTYGRTISLPHSALSPMEQALVTERK